MMFPDDDEDSILNPILPWANSSNIGARRNREGSNITAAASNKSFTKNINIVKMTLRYKHEQGPIHLSMYGEKAKSKIDSF